jgi:hypothetical protein
MVAVHDANAHYSHHQQQPHGAAGTGRSAIGGSAAALKSPAAPSEDTPRDLALQQLTLAVPTTRSSDLATMLAHAMGRPNELVTAA